MKIKLMNNFHNSETYVNAIGGQINNRQVREARRRLCGISTCTCSGDLGTRGNQEYIDGKTAHLIPMQDERSRPAYRVEVAAE